MRHEASFHLAITMTVSRNMSGGSYRSADSGQLNFDFSDILELDNWVEQDPTFVGTNPDPLYSNYAADESYHKEEASNKIGSSETRKEGKDKVAFKTLSHIETLDDGYKWRKYGKKMVKNSPNPRNYYRCSMEGCAVKKRVERDKEDPRYVITTYEGVHNHQTPNQFS